MKRVLIYLVLLLFSLYSCQKEESISIKMDNATMDNLQSEIGVWHNIAVDLYMDSNNKSAEVNYEEVQNEIISELTANYPSTFDARTIAKLKSNSELQLDEIIRASNAKKSGITKEDLVYNTSLVFDFIGNNEYINEQLADELVQLALAIEAGIISEDDLIKKLNH